MPPNWTQEINSVISTTLAATNKRFVDNVFSRYPLLDILKVTGRIDPDDNYRSGTQIEEPLMYAVNNTFSSMGKGDQVTVLPQDPVTKSLWNWKFFGGSSINYRTDDFMNRGDRQIIRLIDVYIKNLEMSASKELSKLLYKDGTGNGGKDPDGLANIVATDPTTGTVGTLDSSVYTWWRNQYKDMSGVSFATSGMDWMDNMINNCEDMGEQLDAIIMPQAIFELFSQLIRDMQIVTINPSESKPRKKMVDVGFRHRNIPYKEIPVFMDRTMPLSTSIYFLDTSSIRFVGDRSHEWFELTPWYDLATAKQPKDKVAYLLLAANLVCNERRRNGVMFNVT